jgi:hypothetical protein
VIEQFILGKNQKNNVTYFSKLHLAFAACVCAFKQARSEPVQFFWQRLQVELF